MTKTLGRVIAIFTVWVGCAGLTYMFHSFGILSGTGAGAMVFVALMATAGIWKS